MSLQIIMGCCGSGKTYKVCNEIAQKSVKYPNENYIIIVPEQFTLQTQQDIVNIHPRNGIINIDILSFMRLAYKVFDELGTKMQAVLEDTGKSMVLRKVIEANKKDLDIFKGNVKKRGFIAELKSLISEFYQYSVTTDKIDEIIASSSDNRLLQIKLKEVSFVYSAFKQYLEDRYITAEEIYDILYDIMDNSNIIKDSIICLDGFTGFTPIQNKIISKMLHLCKKVIVTVTIPPNEDLSNISDEFELFNMSKKTISILKNIAKEEKVTIDKDIVIDDKIPIRFRDSKELAHMQENIFRYPYKQYKSDNSDISITPCNNAKEEVFFVVSKIKELISTKDYRYKDIAIVTGDITTYGRIFERAFEKENMSYFIDDKKSISSNPFIEMIRAGFEIVKKNFSYESVVRFLRCGMSDIDSEDIDIFENFVIALGKHGKNTYQNTWQEPKKSHGEIDIEKINDTRKKVYSDISALVNKFASTNTVLEYSKALYKFIKNMECEKKLEDLRKSFEKKGMFAKEKEYAQIYRFVMDLLDKMVDLLGDEEVSVKEYIDIFEAGIDDMKVGLIPMSKDQIVLGDIERTRLNDIKALFFVGVNDNVIPKEMGTGGIISDLERELLLEKGFELSPTKRQAVYIEQFYLYLALTKPKNNLFLSYSMLDSDGDAIKPSYLIKKIKKIFPRLNEEAKDLTSIEAIVNKNMGMDYLANQLRLGEVEKMSDIAKQLVAFCKQNPSMTKAYRMVLDGAFYSNADSAINKVIAMALFGDSDKSVTEIEKYASCAYAHFLQYGLKIRQRDEYEIQTLDVGNIFHNALEQFSKELERSGYTWKDVTEAFRDRIMDESVDLAVSEYGNYIFRANKRNEYMINRIKRMAKKTVWALCEHVKMGEFVPVGFEVEFSSKSNIPSAKIDIGNNKNVGLKGFVDRIDICNEGEDMYVKVIDYKSGNKEFDPSLFYEGIQLQLLVYMNVAMDKQQQEYNGKKVYPAGVFYYHIDDPIIDKDNKNSEILDDTNDEVLQEIVNEMSLEQLILKGLVNSDVKALKKIDSTLVDEAGNLVNSAVSKVANIKVSKQGELTKTSDAIDKEAFDLFRNHANKVIRDTSIKIYDGQVEARPYKIGEETACKYCKYNGICGFDIKLEGSKYKKIIKRKLNEVIEKLQEDS